MTALLVEAPIVAQEVGPNSCPYTTLAASHSHGASQPIAEPIMRGTPPEKQEKYDRIAEFVTRCYQYVPGTRYAREALYQAFLRDTGTKTISSKLFNKAIGDRFPEVVPGYRVRCPRQEGKKNQPGAFVNIQPKMVQQPACT
ncbi:hypothetical protein WJX73_006412 [Symbiochloris irregularis]|uniref:Uncharacterized protein n=1 Tax=Symbiochloris irregularis TaxID=706552 RepID=A0AAW1PC09_9CHLO